MKSLFRLGMLLAAAATTFASCSKDSAEAPAPESAQVELTLTAGNPEVAPDAQATGTRTEMEGTTPYWSVGDKIGVSTDGTTTHYGFTNDATDRAQTTTFSGTTTVGSTIYTYYPYSSNGISGMGDQAGARVDLPANQTPTAVSFDGKADLLIGKPLAMTAEGTVVGNLQFKRMNAIVKVVLKDNSTGGSLAGQHVASLSIDAGGENYLAGRLVLNLISGKIFEPYYNQSSKVTATYTSATQYAIDGTAGTYLGVFARELPAGSTLKVEAATEGFAISRTITLAQAVDLKAGKINTLTISLTDADITPVATGLELPFTDDFSDLTGNGTAPNLSTRKDQSGNLLYSASDVVYQYNIPHGLRLGKSGTNGYVTTSDLNLSQPFTVLISARAWTGDVTGLKVTAGETVTASTPDLTEEFQTYLLTFDAQSSKTKIRIEPTATKRLIIESIQIVAGQNISTLTLTSAKEVSVAAAGDVVTTTYTVTNPTEGQSVTADAGSATWINTFNYSVTGAVSYTVDANDTGTSRTGTVTFTYPNADAQTVTVNQPAAGAKSYVKVTEALTDWSGTYLIVAYNKTDCFTGAVASNWGASATVTIQEGKITSDATTDRYACTIAASGSGYSIMLPDQTYVATSATGKFATGTTAAVHAITYGTSGVTLKQSNNAVLRCNTSSSNRFRYYTSATGVLVDLYKLEN